ncbi:MAG: hypothetical protein ACKOCB_00875 [Planctomycetia bacterium]
MAQPSEKTRLLLTIAVAALVVGAVAWLATQDLAEIRAMEAEIEGLDQRIREADTEIRKVPQREERVVVFRAVETKELEVLPSKQKIAEFYSGLSTFFQEAGVRFRELPESKPVESDLAKGIFVTRSLLKGQGEAGSILRFLNMLENDPRLVSVRGLKIDAAQEGPEDAPAAVLHDLEVTLDSYYYAPSGDGPRRVTIQGEEQRLQSPSVRKAIAEFVPERPATYTLPRGASRRDPLQDPRTPQAMATQRAGVEERARQGEAVAAIEADLGALLQVEERGRALMAAGDLFKGDRELVQLAAGVAELSSRVQRLLQARTVTEAALLARLTEVGQRLEDLAGRRVAGQVEITRSLAEKTLRDMQRMFDRGDHAAVTSTAQGWDEFVKGKAVAADAGEVLEQVLRLRARAVVMAEAAEIAVSITGMIVSEDQPSRSVATINGRHRKVGEAIDEAGLVVVQAIRRDAVDFAYKGEVFTRTRARAAGTTAPAGR